MYGTLSVLRKYWRVIVILITPLVLLPVYFVEPDPGDESPMKFKCAYVILIMGVLWTTEAMPLAITALIPVVLFPFLNILSTGQVCQNYMRESVMMFVGGISLALAIEYSGLHKRIALRIMILVGTSPWRLLLGLMITTMFLSCWIVINTAVAAMMLPIVNGLLESLDNDRDSSTTASTDKRLSQMKNLRKLFFLAVGYAANIGGTAVIIGSNPNLIAREFLTAENIGQDGKYTDISFATWIAFNMPIAIINLFITWLYLGFIYLGLPNRTRDKNESTSQLSLRERMRKYPSTHTENPDAPHTNGEIAHTSNIDQMLRTKLAELGRITFHETCVLVLFAIVIMLWFTRDPRIFPGWASLFPKSHVKIGDSSVALAVVLIMFTIPKLGSSVNGNVTNGTDNQRSSSSSDSDTILNWPFIQKNLPWNVILLVGGGFALSDAAGRSGLSKWVGDQLGGLESLPSPVILIIFLLVISCITEVVSNAACANLLLPILIALSKKLNLHPLYLSLPGAVACQYAFMLPVSNPPNAVVFTAGQMKICDMFKAGIFLNFACLTVLFAMNLTWGQLIFNYSDYVYA